jgi:hypothetical protein
MLAHQNNIYPYEVDRLTKKKNYVPLNRGKD